MEEFVGEGGTLGENPSLDLVLSAKLPQHKDHNWLYLQFQDGILPCSITLNRLSEGLSRRVLCIDRRGLKEARMGHF